MLLRLLRRRYGDEVDAAIEARVAAASASQIDLWCHRLLALPKLTQLLAD
jgi:hypothetical protein